MACSLTRAGVRHFKVKAGSTVVIASRSEAHQVEIVHIRYALAPLDETPPFEFTAATGDNNLVVLFECPKAGVPVELVEICKNAPENVLDRFDFNPTEPARVYNIEST